MKKTITILLLSLAWLPLSAGNESCTIRNSSFKDGEKIYYQIFYSVIGIYVNAGYASFSTELENYNGKPVYHITGNGTSNTKYDWIFKVRDRYESYIDTTTLKPYKFIRDVQEGDFKMYDNVTFNHQANTAVNKTGVYKTPSCVQDVLSMIYYTRNLNFENYKPNDRIPFNMFLDNETHNLYIKYLGKETIKTSYGKFKAIKFKPLLIKGTVFEGGEGMTVWVSDDDNHIPLRIESPIVVGSVKVDLVGYVNLRNPFTSAIRFK